MLGQIVMSLIVQIGACGIAALIGAVVIGLATKLLLKFTPSYGIRYLAAFCGYIPLFVGRFLLAEFLGPDLSENAAALLMPMTLTVVIWIVLQAAIYAVIIKRPKKGYIGLSSAFLISLLHFAVLGAAGVIIAMVVPGLSEFIGTDNKSGVVWADVAQKVETSRGVIYRERIVNSKYPDSSASDYTIIHLSATKYRSEGYRSGEHWITMYDDREAGKRVVLLHGQKAYFEEKTTPTDKGRQRNADMINPTKWLERFLSCEYSKLGRGTIEGVLCEGIETTDPAFTGEDAADLQIDRIVGRLWVSVETGYPVRLEVELEGKYSENASIDQFQWDVELEASVFEPNIPPDYEQM